MNATVFTSVRFSYIYLNTSINNRLLEICRDDELVMFLLSSTGMGPREEGLSCFLLRENLSISHNNLLQNLRNAACEMHSHSHFILSEQIFYISALEISFDFLELFGKKLT